MATALSQKKNTVYYINSVIVICLFLFVKYLPPFGAITEMGMAVLGVFVGMLYGWLTVGFAWPSILGLVFLGLTGATTINAAFSSGWGNINAVVLVIMC